MFASLFAVEQACIPSGLEGVAAFLPDGNSLRVLVVEAPVPFLSIVVRFCIPRLILISSGCGLAPIRGRFRSTGLSLKVGRDILLCCK